MAASDTHSAAAYETKLELHRVIYFEFCETYRDATGDCAHNQKPLRIIDTIAVQCSKIRRITQGACNQDPFQVPAVPCNSP